ncbi:hypothetical protein DENSPDRAFT_615320 [Dentipellis sp. KUC8613]|nr:hypothetical protein DENSPDRAFT_615320 [Dentipellis sp. KUC8613]
MCLHRRLCTPRRLRRYPLDLNRNSASPRRLFAETTGAPNSWKAPPTSDRPQARHRSTHSSAPHALYPRAHSHTHPAQARPRLHAPRPTSPGSQRRTGRLRACALGPWPRSYSCTAPRAPVSIRAGRAIRSTYRATRRREGGEARTSSRSKPARQLAAPAASRLGSALPSIRSAVCMRADWVW